MNPALLTSILSAILASGALSRLLESMFPVGSAYTIPIEARRYAYGPVSAVFCAAGCAARITVRAVRIEVLTTTPTLPFRVRIVLDLDIASIVNGVPGAWPVTTNVGDLLVAVRAEGLRVAVPATVRAASTSAAAGTFELRGVLGLEAITALGAAVDIGEIAIVQNLEPGDIHVTGTGAGRVAASAIAAYRDEITAWLGRYAAYALNVEACARYGSRCPARTPPAPPQISIPSVPWLPIALAAGAFWAMMRTR
jgi:hypothetical protein